MVENEACAAEVNGEKSNALCGNNIVDTLIPDLEHTEDEHVENSQHDMWKGRQFPDRDSFRETLAKFAMHKNFAIKPLQTSKTEVTARCADPTCPWHIHASIVASGPEFQVRTYNSSHCCSKPTMGMGHRPATSILVAKWIKEWLRHHPSYTPKEIITNFQLEFGVLLSYRKAWKAKEMAMLVRGSYEESFSILPRYCLELEMTNPGSMTVLMKEDDDSFLRFFWAFGSSIQSFRSSLRPLIVVDGAHLRGKYPGVLLTAVTYDGDRKLFPLAFAIVEIERQDSWEWFLAAISIAFRPTQNLTIVSDRQKGLVQAMSNRFPNAYHCHCVRHVAQNIAERFKDKAIVAKFWRAEKTYRAYEYEKEMADIRIVSDKAYKYIDNIPKEQWANPFVRDRRYDMLTQNIAECRNALLNEVREFPIAKQVEAIRAKLVEFFEDRRLKSQLMETRMTHYAEKVINIELERSCTLGVYPANQWEFQIHSPGKYIDVVLLDKHSCTCRKWDVLGIPCSHALAVIKARVLDPYDFCQHWFTRDTYRQTYNYVLHATRDIRQWRKEATCGCYHPMQEDNLADPKRIEFVRKTDKGIQSCALAIEEKVIIDKHVAILRLKNNNVISFVQKVGRIL